jgi:DNA-binding beta-propeller fold protein YncE
MDELAKYSPNQNAAIAVCKGQNGIGVNSSGDKVYVANSGDNTISVIDEATDSNDR